MSRNRFGRRLATMLVAAAVSAATLLTTAAPARASSGSFEIKSYYTELCLTVDSLDAGDQVVQRTCQSAINQVWDANYFGRGHRQLQSEYSGLCIDVENGVATEGAAVVQMPCDWVSTQSWLSQWRPTTDPNPDRWWDYELSGNLCIGVEWENPVDGTGSWLEDCAGGDNQVFEAV